MKKPEEKGSLVYAPLVCKKCGAEYTGLACTCFQVTADNEIERIGFERFLKQDGPLYVSSKKHRHIMPQAHSCLSICRNERLPKHEVAAIYKRDLAKSLTDAAIKKPVCSACLDKVLERMK